MSIAAHHIEHIKTLLGPKGCKQDAEDIAPFVHEWRDTWHGQTPLIALPADTAQTAELVAYCAANHIPITTQGGNTGLVGGQIPQGELLVSTKRLNKMRALDRQNSTLTVGAGMVLAEAKALAKDAGLLLPLNLASEGSASIGGVLSTNAGGMEVLRYGNARDLTLGLEVVTARGEIWDGLSGLRKDNSGYDLKQAFIGAEGTLGIITAATLKLFAAPASRQTAWCAVPSVEAAIALLGHVREAHGDAISKFELIPQIGVDYAVKNIAGNRAVFSEPAPWHVLLEIGIFGSPQGQSTLDQALSKALEAGIILNAAIAQTEAQAAQFLRLRESLSAAQKGEGIALKHDISVPVSQMARFIHEASQAVQVIGPDCRVFAFGHVGDGNVHFNILQPRAMSADSFKGLAAAITASIYQHTLALGGSISAEHGIGIMKKSSLKAQKSEVEMRLMRAFKTALDPDNIMNPRVLF